MAQAWYGHITALFDNATYKAEGYTAFFTQGINDQSREIDDERLQVWTQISTETYTQLREDLVFKLSGHAVFSSQESELRGVFTPPGHEEPEARFLDLREVYMRLEKESFDLTIGKALVPMGLSTLYSPADRYSFLNGANPLHSAKYGVWQAALDYFIGDDTLSFIVLPFEERVQSPTGNSRWLGLSGDDAFFSLRLPGVAPGAVLYIREEFRSDEPEYFGDLLIYSGVR